MGGGAGGVQGAYAGLSRTLPQGGCEGGTGRYQVEKLGEMVRSWIKP